MHYFPSSLTRVQSDEFAASIYATIERQGWGLWAVQVKSGAPFIGFVGLSRPRFKAHFAPAVEVGWRLDHAHWGHGYATEAVLAALTFAFGRLMLGEVVSFTTELNERSRNVMRRLGMSHDPADDFDHPRVASGSLRRHALYRITRERWRGPLAEGLE